MMHGFAVFIKNQYRTKHSFENIFQSFQKIVHGSLQGINMRGIIFKHPFFQVQQILLLFPGRYIPEINKQSIPERISTAFIPILKVRYVIFKVNSCFIFYCLFVVFIDL